MLFFLKFERVIGSVRRSVLNHHTHSFGNFDFGLCGCGWFVCGCGCMCGCVWVCVCGCERERDVKTLTKLDFLLTMTDEKLYAFVFLGDNFFVCWLFSQKLLSVGLLFAFLMAYNKTGNE